MQARLLLFRLSLYHNLCYHSTNIAHHAANVAQLSTKLTHRLTTQLSPKRQAEYRADQIYNRASASTTCPAARMSPGSLRVSGLRLRCGRLGPPSPPPPSRPSALLRAARAAAAAVALRGMHTPHARRQVS